MNEVLKDSGVPWIGLINKNYKQIKLKWIVSTKITDGPHTTPELQDEGIPFLSAEAVKNSILDFEYKRGYISISDHEEFCKKCKPKLNDIFMVKSGATTGNIGIVNTDEEFSVWSPLALIRCNAEKANQKFIYYAMLSSCFKTEVELSWSYGTQQNIGMGVIENIHVILPSLNEQKAIAYFLDKKCKKIDKLISLEETAIIELTEYKKSIIQKAVTKGIKTSRKLKNSGIDWIGDIPEEWETKKIKSCCFMKSGDNLTSNDICENNIFPVYGGNGLRGYYNNYNRNGNYLLIGRQGALCGNIHKINGKFWATDHAVVVEINESTNIDWYYYMLIYMDLNQYSESAAQPGLSVQKIQSLSTCFPTLNEQREIAEYLDKKISTVDNLIAIKQQKITELKEYKKSLIYEYVTGKKQPPKKDTK